MDRDSKRMCNFCSAYKYLLFGVTDCLSSLMIINQFVFFHIFHHKHLESGNGCITLGFHCIITLDNIFFLEMATHFNAGPNYLDGSQTLLSHGY